MDEALMRLVFCASPRLRLPPTANSTSPRAYASAQTSTAQRRIVSVRGFR